MSEKIQPSHIEREAYVYIRQSSMQQVRTRLEGQGRQYDLRERALGLGFQRVVVIDEDLGRSGTGSVERPGFGRLLAAVCSGKVGAVLALEASRLARNNVCVRRNARLTDAVGLTTFCWCFATQALSFEHQFCYALDGGNSELFTADGESGSPSQVRTPGCLW
jgi:hypothetical protein